MASAPEQAEGRVYGLRRFAELPDVCFVEDVARVLECSPRTLRRILRSGCGPHELRRIDRRRRFSKEAVLAWVHHSRHGARIAGRAAWR